MCLFQRNVFPVPAAGPGRFASPTRAVLVVEAPEGTIVIISGERVNDFHAGLRGEAGLPLFPDQRLARVISGGSLEAWRVNRPRDWHDRIAGEDRQRREARIYVQSDIPARRCAGASTMARLDLADRGPWIEDAVVAWEQDTSGNADLSFAGLCIHELRWLREAQDKLAPRLHAFLFALAGQNHNLMPIAMSAGPCPELDESPDELLERVPNEMAAAAAGIRRRKRAAWVGPGRLLAEANATTDTRKKAGAMLRAGLVLARRYSSGWRRERLEDAVELIGQAVKLLESHEMPKTIAFALARSAEVWDMLEETELAQFDRERALDLLDDGEGGLLDAELAEELRSLLP
ncbi:MAG: hypothetical protein GY913_01285 [Proteobacteria bacterium]|nr:hypothetical protein [Pseudomonadota bacterium]